MGLLTCCRCADKRFYIETGNDPIHAGVILESWYDLVIFEGRKSYVIRFGWISKILDVTFTSSLTIIVLA